MTPLETRTFTFGYCLWNAASAGGSSELIQMGPAPMRRMPPTPSCMPRISDMAC